MPNEPPKIRDSVRILIELGPCPAIDRTSVEQVDAYDKALRSIEPPLSDEEALSLLGIFGPDDYFGLSWTLLHLIEETGVPRHLPPFVTGENEWLTRMRDRQWRASTGAQPGRDAVPGRRPC